MKPINVTPAPVIKRGGFSIQTRFLSPTANRGPRVKAWRVDRLNGETETVTVSFDHAAACAHSSAAAAWFVKHGRPSGVSGKFHLLRGACDRGHVFTVIFE
jgi:hypothetical protein